MVAGIKKRYAEVGTTMLAPGVAIHMFLMELTMIAVGYCTMDGEEELRDIVYMSFNIK